MDSSRHFTVFAERSTVVVHARSSVGPIVWEGVGPVGGFSLDVVDGAVRGTGASGFIELPLAQLTSGNRVYDAELLRRIDARRNPLARVDLTELSETSGGAFRARAVLGFAARTVPMTGTLEIDLQPSGSVTVIGEQAVDIRDFHIPPPSMLMLKIFPDVRVHLLIEGRPTD